MDCPGPSIHHETIYRYVYGGPQARTDKLWQFLSYHRYRRLKQHTGRKVKAEKLDGILRITERPISALFREQVGHWETDNMVGRVSDTAVISALVERKTRYVHLSLLPNKSAQSKAESVVERLGIYPFRMRRTVTTDNGSENRNHNAVTEEVGTPVYFCNPYHSWEKGTVENTIGRVRKFLPKGKPFDMLTDDAVAAVEDHLNNTPRKCLGFKTPSEAMREDLMGVPVVRSESTSQPEMVWIPEVLE